LSKRLHRRDPVVNNFLYTWILLSALASFDQLAVIGQCNLGDTTAVREQVLELITLISTLNLSIHLWCIMRAAFHQSSPQTRKIRTSLLVISPYLIGLLPLIAIFNPDAGNEIVGLFSILVCTITPVMDLVLLVYYWRWYRKVRKAKMKGVMSISFFVRLLAFSTYQLAYILFLGLGASLQSVLWSTGFKIVQNLFPLLAFCVIGLHKDILTFWFPCLHPRPSSSPKESVGMTYRSPQTNPVSSTLRPSNDDTRVGHTEEATMIEPNDDNDREHLLADSKQNGLESV